MASSTLLSVIALISFMLISSQASSIGNEIIECETLDEKSCAYAVSSSGKRCVLEKHVLSNGYSCGTSEIVANKLSGLIETEACVESCGVKRNDLGISSDYFLESAFVESLCSDECYHYCPNIVDLFFDLAAGEGIYLPRLCETRESDGRRREMSELTSVGGKQATEAPAPAPPPLP